MGLYSEQRHTPALSAGILVEELGGVTRRALDMSSRDGDVVMFVTVTIWSDGAGVLFCALLIHHAAAS